MTTSSSGIGGAQVSAIIIVSIVVGILTGLVFPKIWPPVLKDGDYDLALPNDGAIAVQLENEKVGFYQVPPEAVNYVVDPAKAWKAHVTVRRPYSLVTIYVPSENYLPKGSVRQSLTVPGISEGIIPPEE